MMILKAADIQLQVRMLHLKASFKDGQVWFSQSRLQMCGVTFQYSKAILGMWIENFKGR